MKKNKSIFLLLIVTIFSMSFFCINGNESAYWIYNKKGQLIADTNLIADERLGAFYKNDNRQREVRINSEILNMLTISQRSIESGCMGSIILKLNMVQDVNEPLNYIIENISPIFDTTNNCLMYQYEINRICLVGKRIRSSYIFNGGYRTNNFYMYVPIKTKLNYSNYSNFEPSVKKYIENGYFVVEVNTFYQ